MLKLLTNRWLFRILGLLAIALIVFMLGPFFAFGRWRPLASFAARGGLVALIVALWALKHFLARQRAQKAQNRLVDELVQVPVAQGLERSSEEIATLKERFEEAIGVLKKARGGRGRLNLYELPWYIVIGPPGAGKTTALVNSGLRFPLGDRFGPEAVRGIGGTRNCDWWFTDQAVLIDTAGRYTTQDSDTEVDRAAWLGFLDLLKKYRKRRPINGTFVAISIADLMLQSEAERRAHAAAIKQRVMELDKHFGIRFPVYVMFTKCDLAAGFTEFFDDLGKAEREQVWGLTFPYSDHLDANPVGGFEAEFDRVIRRLNERQLARMSQETDPARRALIHGFPKQMAALRENLGGFLKDIFQGSRYETGPLLRGAYFTSGTQDGTPIDRLMGSLARTFQIDPGALAGRRAAGKSFFLTHLLQQLAFREANLAGTNRRAERRRAWLQRAAYAGTAGVVALAVAAWVFSYIENRAEIRAVTASANAARTLIGKVDQHDRSFAAVLPALDAVRDIPGGWADRLAGGSWLHGFGLSQSGKLGDQAVESYRRLLEQLLLSRIMLHLEDQLRQGGGQTPDYAYETLKAYLMLDSKDHYDGAAVEAFVQADWANSLPATLGAPQRKALTAHLDALFEQRPLPLPLPLSDSLISAARREVNAIPLEQRIYGRLKRTFSADIPGFDVRDAAGGPTAELVFTRKSGKPLSEALPGLFTKAGYQKVFIGKSRELTAELASEAWVLGTGKTLDKDRQEELLARVRELYLDEFAERYTALLDDVSLAPFATAGDAARIFNILARPNDSPLLLLIKGVAKETSLDEANGDPSLVARAESKADQLKQRLQSILGTSDKVPDSLSAMIAKNAVQERFQALNALV
ncbi:MAG TPA: type VI secretion system membrane subunit TssM, partial [Gammaproteobacteria bacterium]|nr:type VI secretion system membrane subunit TssM [Gammaproteobacteria bacterium]